MIQLDEDQKKAVRKMADTPLRACLNASETGTGKTVMAVELAKEIGAETVLIIGPANPKVVDSWRRTFATQRYPYPFVQIDRKTMNDIDVTDLAPGVYYVSKEFARLHDALGKKQGEIPWHKSRFDLVVADESHFASNRKAQTTRTLWRFKHAGYRLALSATPQGSSFAGFWSLCRFLWYDVLKEGATEETARAERYIIDSSYQRWEAEWCATKTEYFNGHTVTKVTGCKDGKDFTGSLPCYVSLKAVRKPTHTRLVEVELSAEQRRLHDEMLKEAVAWLADGNVLTADYAMTKTLRLRQITLAEPYINKDGEIEFQKNAPSSKADMIEEILDYHSGEKIVVYTTSERFTRLLADRLKDRAVLWTGKVSKKKREENLEDFLEGDTQVLIATYGAIAEGMDGLQHVCNIEVWADESYSVVQSTQVAGRLNRRGQTEDIIRYRLLAENTADTETFEKMVERVSQRKAEL